MACSIVSVQISEVQTAAKQRKVGCCSNATELYSSRTFVGWWLLPLWPLRGSAGRNHQFVETDFENVVLEETIAFQAAREEGIGWGASCLHWAQWQTSAASPAPRAPPSARKTVRNETAASSVTGGRALALVRVAGAMLASLRETATCCGWKTFSPTSTTTSEPSTARHRCLLRFFCGSQQSGGSCISGVARVDHLPWWPPLVKATTSGRVSHPRLKEKLEAAATFDGVWWV